LSGLADHAILAEASRDDGDRLLLGIADVPQQARAACAGAVAEALRLAQINIPLDSVFVGSGEPLHAALEKVGLRFDIPKVTPPARTAMPPGSDPDKPPILN